MEKRERERWQKKLRERIRLRTSVLTIHLFVVIVLSKRLLPIVVLHVFQGVIKAYSVIHSAQKQLRMHCVRLTALVLMPKYFLLTLLKRLCLIRVYTHLVLACSA